MSWLLIIAIGLITFGLRASFILSPINKSWPAFERALSYAPVTVLPAIALSAVIGDGQGPLPERISAALVAALVAWITRSMAAALVIGMLVLWLLQYSF